jgi:hypothetical protein
MIDIDEEKNPLAYYDLDEGVKYCLSIPDKELDKPVNFHAFWIGDFGRKPALPIKSFFATQNTKHATFNLWTREDLSDNEYLKPFRDQIVFREWNPVEEAKGTTIENLPYLNATDNRCWVDGDLFRLLVLHKYGGVYIDMDVVLLRDFGPLLDQEFMYKWGTERNMINGALMHLNKNSLLSKQLLYELSRRSPRPNSTCWGNDVYVTVRSSNKNWTVFPAAFFDSEWQTNPEQFNDRGLYNGLLQPFLKCKHSNFLYNGAFSWHWHGHWKDTIEEGSKWQILEAQIEKLLEVKGYGK